MSRHRSLYRIAGLVAYLFVITMVTGCKPPSAIPSVNSSALNGALIVFIGPPANDPQWPGFVGGARCVFKTFDMLKVEYRNPADYQPESLSKTVAAVLAEQPRLVVLYGRNPETLSAAAQAVLDGHVQLVTAGARTNVLGVFGHVEEDLPEAAELLGTKLDQIAGEKKSYLLVHDKGRDERGAYIYERFMGKARDFKGLTMLTEEDARNALSPRELIAGMFAQFPHAGFTVTLASVFESPELLEALRGREAGYAALGASPALWDDLRSGKALALAGINDGELGAAAAAMAIDALTQGREPGAIRLVESELVTRETLPDFMQRYAAATGLSVQEKAVSPESLAPVSASPETRPADRP